MPKAKSKKKGSVGPVDPVLNIRNAVNARRQNQRGNQPPVESVGSDVSTQTSETTAQPDNPTLPDSPPLQPPVNQVGTSLDGADISTTRRQLLDGTKRGRIHITIFIALSISLAISEAEDCFYKPCQQTGTQNKKCQFNIGCRTEGSFAKCNVSGMHIDGLSGKQSKCIDPGMVPGFKYFCMDLLHVTSIPSPGPANINNDDKPGSPADDVVHESKAIVDNGNCFGTTILVSVASGCFLAGGFTVWLVMFCCRMTECCRSQNKDAAVSDAGNNLSSWTPSIRDRPIGSTSSAQLLTNASVESMSTNNTLLSVGESQPFSDSFPPRHSSASRSTESPGTSSVSERHQGGHARSPSAPWAATGRPLLPNSRSRSAQWIGPRRMTMGHSPAQTSHWAESGQMSLPSSQAPTAEWIDQGQLSFTNGHSQSAPWLDTIYSPASESSSRDYQSIHGGSENPYAPCSESSSDYSAPHTHRVMIIHDGEIYQPSSESSGSNNDYTSLKGRRFSRPNESIYYPTSEGSNKDYASLTNDKDINGVAESHPNTVEEFIQRDREDQRSNVTFNVSGLTFPVQASARSNLGWVSSLQEINEYETVDSTRKDGGLVVDVNSVSTIADMCDVYHNTESPVQTHEYFTLEPL